MQCVALGLALLAGAAVAAPYPTHGAIELVESKPVETFLDTPGMRATGDVWLDTIRTSQRTLDIGAFYFSSRPGSAMEPVLDAIRQAARRGVRVRVLIDRTFRAKYPAVVAALERVHHLALREIDLEHLTTGVMHAKYFVVDGAQVFLGSQNFDWKALTHIHEIGVRLTDPRAARTVEAIFELDWAIAGLSPRPTSVADPRVAALIARRAPADAVTAAAPVTLPFGSHSVQVALAFSPATLNPPGVDAEEPRLVAAIDAAQHEVDVQVLEYSVVAGGEVYPVIEDALRRAAVRGARVRLLVSSWSLSRRNVPWLQRLATVPGVEVRAGTLPAWSGGFVNFARVEHCKYMVVDRTLAFVGTGNWEKSYFHTTRNMSAFLTGGPFAGQLSAMFDRDWDGAYAQPVVPGATYAPPVLSRPDGI